MKELKTLDDHNAERMRIHGEKDKGRLNGIACPVCFMELWDPMPNATLTSNPPQKDVKCYACGYEGYRVA